MRLVPSVQFAFILSFLLILSSSAIIANAQTQPSPSFFLWSSAPEVKSGWHVKIYGRICPTPPVAEEVKAYYYLVRPDGSIITIFDDEPSFTCKKDTLIHQFKPDMTGTWSVAAVYKWTSLNEPTQQVQSNVMNFSVK